jgi:type I restriction enzyme S subunit
MSNWSRTTIGAVTLRVTKGTTPKLGGFTQQGVAYVKVESITAEGRINPAKLAYIDEDTNQLLARSILRADDLLFSIAGTIGRVARVTPEILPANTNQALAIVRPDHSKVDVRYLLYCLRDKDRVQEALSLVVQSVQANLSLSELSAIEIPLPPLPEQRAIAEVLGALDDKIAANTRVATTIDEYLGQSFVRLLRGGYEPVRLDEVAAVNSKTVKPVSGAHLRYVDIASVGVGSYEFPEIMSWDEAPSRARRAIRKGDTLWSTVRPNRRSHALNLSSDPLLVGSTGLAVLTPKTVGWAYLYEVTRQPEFTAYLETVAEGSAYPAVRADRFEAAPVPMVSGEARRLFESMAEPLRESAHNLSGENRTLAATRDVLLPQLMSGKLRVKDAEKVLEGAGV